MSTAQGLGMEFSSKAQAKHAQPPPPVKGQGVTSVSRGTVFKPDDLSLVPGTHMGKVMDKLL